MSVTPDTRPPIAANTIYQGPWLVAMEIVCHSREVVSPPKEVFGATCIGQGTGAINGEAGCMPLLNQVAAYGSNFALPKTLDGKNG